MHPPTPLPAAQSRRALLLAALAALAASAGPAHAWPWPQRSAARALALMALMAGAGPWLNTPTGTAPNQAPDWDGQVLLVNVWTYSCINSLRALPSLRAWHAHYGERGLSVVGVHCPEFAFERDPENVRAALTAQGIGYPVVCDNDFSLWRALGNTFWPSFYLLDPQGRVRHTQFGEGGYAEIEHQLRQLLSEGPRNPDALPAPLGPAIGHGVQAAASAAGVPTPETYLGHARGQRFESPGGFAKGRSAVYGSPPVLRPGGWGLRGRWTVQDSLARSDGEGAVIVLRFQARDVHLVMGPMPPGAHCEFQIILDGQPPGADHGIDVDAQGVGQATAHRLYQLVRHAGVAGEQTLEIRFGGAGIQAYALTFG